MLCIISSNKLGIFSKWAIRVRGRERLEGKWPGWLGGRLIRVNRLNKSLERLLVEGSLVGRWVGR